MTGDVEKVEWILKMKNKRKQFGMTLVEILVTIVIIAILAAGLFTVSNYMTKQSDIELAKAELEIIDVALEEYS